MNMQHPAYEHSFAIETAQFRADLLTNETGIKHKVITVSDGVFAAVIDNAPPMANSSQKECAFKTISFNELLSKDYQANWLVTDFIEHGNWGLVFGASASCKSFLIQELAFCVAAGIPFHEKEVSRGAVLYVAGEGFSGLSRRFKALQKHHGVAAEQIHFSCQPADFIKSGSAKAVAEKANEIGNVKLMIIDTLHRNMTGNENTAEDVATFLLNIDIHLKISGMAVIVIHHSGNDNDKRARGSSSLLAAMDVAYRVEKSDTGIVTVTNAKMKEFEPPKPESFAPKKIELDGFVSSIVLEKTEYTGAKSSKSLSANASKALQSLHKTIELYGIAPPKVVVDLFPDSPRHIPAKVVLIEQWRELAYDAITVDSEGDKKQKALQMAFYNNRISLEGKKFIGFHGDYVWVL
jgi:hypothetical protein